MIQTVRNDINLFLIYSLRFSNHSPSTAQLFLSSTSLIHIRILTMSAHSTLQPPISRFLRFQCREKTALLVRTLLCERSTRSERPQPTPAIRYLIYRRHSKASAPLLPNGWRSAAYYVLAETQTGLGTEVNSSKCYHEVDSEFQSYSFNYRHKSPITLTMQAEIPASSPEV